LACHWRIRHKLILGLGLVVVIVALLLAGTYRGLASYRDTTNNIDSKLVELHHAQNLKEALKGALKGPLDVSAATIESPEELRGKFRPAREALAEYEKALHETLDKQRDPNRGFREKDLVEALHEKFADLDRAIDAFVQKGGVIDSASSQSLIVSEPAIKKAATELVRTTDELHGAIYDSLFKRTTTAKSDFRTTMILVLAISIGGILLLTGLLRFFYRWTFHPVRDLQQGVGRIAQGDFEHSIDVHSGDEMEELAAAFNDMTTRLREMYRDLARQVNERSRQLVRSERLAGVGFLAAGVAHEINNPLASIAFCSEALEARLKKLLSGAAPLKRENPRPYAGSPPAMILQMHTEDLEPDHAKAALPDTDLDEEREVITKYLKMIQNEAFRCKEITQRLLEFSRGGERRREPTDLTKIIQSVLDTVQHLPIAKGKRILFPPPAGGNLTAWVNGQEIQSVVLNLVVNALDSMDEGGALTIALRERDRMAEMVFADTGCGMSGEVLENIFEPFFTRSRTGKGTGLGLSISHRIINQHGGEIEAASPGPGQGSTFTVRVPLQPAENGAEEAAARAAA
jgi:signal transduction histidine kinase